MLTVGARGEGLDLCLADDGLVLSDHDYYLLVRSLKLEPKWLGERTDRITRDSKDFSHIKNIRDHYVHGRRPWSRTSNSGGEKDE